MPIDQLLVAITGAVAWLIYDQQSLLEFSVVVASILVHVLDARQNIWSKILVFPIVFTAIYIYWVRQLYGKVIYNIIFICFNLYAYLRWKGSMHRPPLQVSRTSHKVLLSMIGISILGGIGWIAIVSKYFNKSLSISVYGDACYLFFGFMDKWLMVHKKLERWVIAFFRYIAFALACYQTGAIMLSMHYLILACVAVYGQIKWYVSYKAIKTS